MDPYPPAPEGGDGPPICDGAHHCLHRAALAARLVSLWVLCIAGMARGQGAYAGVQ